MVLPQLIILIALAVITFIIIAVVKQHKKGLTKRPIIFSILCLIIFIYATIMFFAIIFNYEKLSQAFGNWYPATIIVLIIGSVIGGIGIWKLKKWGAYFYIGTVLVNIYISNKEGDIAGFGYLNLVILLSSIGVLLYNFKKLTD